MTRFADPSADCSTSTSELSRGSHPCVTSATHPIAEQTILVRHCLFAAFVVILRSPLKGGAAKRRARACTRRENHAPSVAKTSGNDLVRAEKLSTGGFNKNVTNECPITLLI